MDINPCVCDITSVCDTNCCCDEDCTPKERSLFEFCIPTGPVNKNFQFCSTYLKVNNLPPNASFQVGDSLMCLAFNNNPNGGVFFEYPSLVQNNEVFNEITGNIQFSFSSNIPNNNMEVETHYSVYNLI